MAGVINTCLFSRPPLQITSNKNKSKFTSCFIKFPCMFCKFSGNETESNQPSRMVPRITSKNKMEDYNTAMKTLMRNPYEYHHDLGQKAEDIDHLKEEQKVGYILNLQQDGDIEYWGIDLQSIIKRSTKLGIRHMRRPAKDFDPESLRLGLPKAVSLLEWAISEGNGRVYVHCTAGLGRAPAVVIAYMYWFCDMNLNTAYDTLTSKRPCGPKKRAIRGATYDLAKNDPSKEPFESLPEFAFEGIADWERKLIQDRVLALRET
ncbi:phosphoglucan phosphatase LSF2, chloroplastic isoform X2 [Primulina eburnea]|uniref:phosphoglucan phosphatase LSF2, chloroplastic isoform X2 n=1 Tax=Primulina eburnea TaxID=1245227 RepID=UPI003C6C3AED